MNQRNRNRLYVKELGGAMLLYIGMLYLALTIGQRMPPGAPQTAVYVSPMLPFLLAVWAIVRQIRRSDEFMRKTMVERLAVAAAVTAGWTFTYGFMEIAGYPRLSMFIVWPVMGGVWGVLSAIDHLRHP